MRQSGRAACLPAGRCHQGTAALQGLGHTASGRRAMVTQGDGSPGWTPGARLCNSKPWQNRRPGSRAAATHGDSLGAVTPAPPMTWGALPSARGASGFSLEPAPAPMAPEGAAEPFLPAWGGADTREVLPTLKGAGGAVLAAGLRACRDADWDHLADGLAPGPSDLGWEPGTGLVEREGLRVRAQVSGMGASGRPLPRPPGRSPSASPGSCSPVPTLPSRGMRRAVGRRHPPVQPRHQLTLTHPQTHRA